MNVKRVEKLTENSLEIELERHFWVRSLSCLPVHDQHAAGLLQLNRTRTVVSDASDRIGTIVPRPCIDCGMDISDRQGKVKRCQPCNIAIRRRRDIDRRRAKV